MLEGMLRRSLLFLLLVVFAALALLSYFATFLPHETMMWRMMGGRTTAYLPPMLLTISTTTAIIVLAYVIAFPNIRIASDERTENIRHDFSFDSDPLSIVMRVSKPDEHAVLDVVNQSGGTCFQKDVLYKTGLSKLKTHRIVARLAERGIILVQKHGKTNQISLPNWLKKQSSPAAPSPNES